MLSVPGLVLLTLQSYHAIADAVAGIRAEATLAARQTMKSRPCLNKQTDSC